MSYSQSWLEDTNARRCILVKATVNYYNGSSWSEIIKYFSNYPYMTTDAAIVFLPIIANGFSFSEELSTSSGVSFSYGDIELHNNGEYDNWLDTETYIWTNRPVQVYYGDPSWISANEAAIYSSFELIFDGLISDINSKNRTKINILVRDKMEKLNTPITENKLGATGTWGGGGQTNSENIKPLILGEVHNIEPILMDPSTLEYMFHDGSIGPAEQLIEIRDNGVPIYTAGVLTGGATVDNTEGTFTLTAPLVGVCTVSVQGLKKSIDFTGGGSVLNTYNNNIAHLIALITTQLGKSYTKLAFNELDLTNLSNFATANDASVGIAITDRESLLGICEQLASSLGAQVYFTRQGLLQILRLGVYTSDPSVDITDSDILQGSLYVSGRTSIVAATKLGYARNYTVQDNLLSAIPSKNKTMFASEWYDITVVDSTIKALYKLNEDPVQKDTALIVAADATAEATRLNNYYKTLHPTYRFKARSKLLSLKLGQEVTLTHNRFGLSGGKSGQVTFLGPDWSRGIIDVGVTI